MTAIFQPKVSGTNQIASGTISVTTGSAATALGDGNTLLLTNTHASNTCYINFGTAGTAATTSDMPILPGNQILITRPTPGSHIACIGSGSLTLLYTLGA